MNGGRQQVTFEGLLEENVLGTFKVIRGFADLRDLAAVSVAIPYQGEKDGTGTGYQRAVDEQHVDDIARFLSRGRYRFFPEIVLSLRSSGKDDAIVAYAKRRAARSDGAYRVTVRLKALRDEGLTRIHRIDGNHRLEAASRLFDQKGASGLKSFAKAPFCFVVLHSDRLEDDELAEAMLFNLINSKALRITSEHSLSVLMRDDGPPADRFAEDPQVYLTRRMAERVKGWPLGFYAAMGENPLSGLHSTAGVLLRSPVASTGTEGQLKSWADELFGPLCELAVKLRDQYERFVHSYAFLPVAAEVYLTHSGDAKSRESERMVTAERWLREFAAWFSRVGAVDLPVPADPSVLWNVFKRDYDRRPGAVFVAMSFRENKTLGRVYKAIEEAIDQFNKTHPGASLLPIRIDRQHGASFDIPARVFQEIDNSRLLIADLTDEKQNVYCEIGYAKARGIPFFLTFRQQGSSGVASHTTREHLNRVHFDLAPLKYIAYEDPLDLRDKLQVELNAWHASRE